MRRIRPRFVLYAAWVATLVGVRRTLKGRRHPSWGYRYEVVAEIMRRESAWSVNAPLEAVRRRIDRPTGPPPGYADAIRIEPVSLGGVAAEEITPAGYTASSPVVFYLHGGGYVFCNPATHRDLVSRVAVTSGARALTLDYRRAPEHPFPSAIDDAVAAYKALVASGVSPSRIVLAGDSAGGGLALATMLRLRDGEGPLPRGAVLMSPWVDLTLSGPTIDQKPQLDYILRPGLERFVPQYLAGADPLHPLASPLHANLRGLPPLMVIAGGVESFRWENEELVRRARAAGVDATLHLEEGMVHAYPAFAIVLPEVRPVFRTIAAFIGGARGAAQATRQTATA